MTPPASGDRRGRERSSLPPRTLFSNGFYAFSRIFFHCCYRFLGRYTAEGLENIPQTGPFLLIANHESFLDPPIIATALNRNVWFMAKEELFKPRILRTYLRWIRAFPVRRATADRTALRCAQEVLVAGDGLLIFPEGERTRDGKLQPPQLGAAMIALRSRSPVIPVAIRGTRAMLPPGSSKMKRGQIHLTYGPPLDLSDLYESKDREALEKCADRMIAAIADLLGVPPPVSLDRSHPASPH